MTSTSLQLVMVGVNFSAASMATLTAKAISQAEAEVDKYLSKRYDLTAAPFVPAGALIPPIVVQTSERLAEAYMWQWMSRGSKDSLKRAQAIIDDVKPNLESIRDYEMDVIDSTGAVVADKSKTAFRVQCSTTDYTPTFDEGPVTQFEVDPTKLDDIANSKSIVGVDNTET
jgi:hypothetical protein